MFRVDWTNPKSTISAVEELVSANLGNIYDGLLVEDNFLYVRTTDAMSSEQEDLIKSLIYNLNDQPAKVAIQSQPSISISSAPTPPAFSSKTVIVNGVTKSLFKRHTGIQAEVYVAQPTTILFTIPYNWCKITGACIINGEVLDSINLYVLDTDTNTYSQAPVGVVGPNFQLNQFGFNVNVAKDYFQNTSAYDADLYIGMKIKIVYISKSDKTIGINIDLHEVK